MPDDKVAIDNQSQRDTYQDRFYYRVPVTRFVVIIYRIGVLMHNSARRPLSKSVGDWDAVKTVITKGD